jgi:hypothetical protein
MVPVMAAVVVAVVLAARSVAAKVNGDGDTLHLPRPTACTDSFGGGGRPWADAAAEKVAREAANLGKIGL